MATATTTTEPVVTTTQDVTVSGKAIIDVIRAMGTYAEGIDRVGRTAVNGTISALQEAGAVLVPLYDSLNAAHKGGDSKAKDMSHDRFTGILVDRAQQARRKFTATTARVTEVLRFPTWHNEEALEAYFANCLKSQAHATFSGYAKFVPSYVKGHYDQYGNLTSEGQDAQAAKEAEALRRSQIDFGTGDIVADVAGAESDPVTIAKNLLRKQHDVQRQVREYLESMAPDDARKARSAFAKLMRPAD